MTQISAIKRQPLFFCHPPVLNQNIDYRGKSMGILFLIGKQDGQRKKRPFRENEAGVAAQ